MSDQSTRLSRTGHSLPKKNVLTFSVNQNKVMFKRFFTDHSRSQFLRYIIVGTWNTAFGYGCFFLQVRFFLYFLLALVSITAFIAFEFLTVINLTVSFLGYK